MNNFHTSVLLKEATGLLQVEKGKKYIDATIGGGGHTQELIKRGGIVLGIDFDKDAIAYINKNFKFQISNFKLIPVQGNFKDIDKIAHLKGFDKVSGIIFDLGVSGHQLEEGQRGFSFQKEGPLDMRMDRDLEVKAADLINALTKEELYELFFKLGEERRAWTISDAIIRARRIKPIESTRELASIVEGVYGKDRASAFERENINKRVFQALRIAVNDELNNLKEGLAHAIKLLETNGRLAVISFHSLEDRIVKQKFINFEKINIGKIITKKPIVPSRKEMEKNRRSKNAKLRVFEKN